jgi:hypothetical protein
MGISIRCTNLVEFRRENSEDVLVGAPYDAKDIQPAAMLSLTSFEDGKRLLPEVSTALI